MKELAHKAAAPGGIKYDESKLRLDLLPPHALEEIAEVFTYGADKYAARNYEAGIQHSRLYAAIQRHLYAYWKGQDLDEESALSHLAHAATDILILMELQRLKPELDDRP